MSKEKFSRWTRKLSPCNVKLSCAENEINLEIILERPSNSAPRAAAINWKFIDVCSTKIFPLCTRIYFTTKKTESRTSSNNFNTSMPERNIKILIFLIAHNLSPKRKCSAPYEFVCSMFNQTIHKRIEMSRFPHSTNTFRWTRYCNDDIARWGTWWIPAWWLQRTESRA